MTATEPGPQPDGAGGRPRTLRALESPEVLAVSRWLPRPFPAGAFSGRHDRVHVGDRHGVVNLWWEDSVVHPGHYVGPPRGGLHPGPTPTYSVAMPAGGYLRIENGVLTEWSDGPGSGPLVRADGEVFDPAGHSPARPYFASHYAAMTPADARTALLGVRRRNLRAAGRPESVSARQAGDPRSDIDQQVRVLQDLIRSAEGPILCECRSTAGSRPTTWPAPITPGPPAALLGHAQAIAIMSGVGGADDAVDMVWRLTGEVADPVQVGLIRAATAAIQRARSGRPEHPETGGSGGGAATAPGKAAEVPEPPLPAPLTEDAVALVAAQAVRWHGADVVDRLPFWTLGWIFLAAPVLQGLRHDGLTQDELQSALDDADKIRLERTRRTWLTAHDATTDLNRLADFANGRSRPEPTEIARVLDLRATGPGPGEVGNEQGDQGTGPGDQQPAPEPSAELLAYGLDIATVLAGQHRP